MSKFPLIVFEGIDGSGKTHHINKIKSYLKKKKIKFIILRDPKLRARLNPDDAALRVYNYLHSMTLEAQLLARACGKTNIHSLEPEDLAALTSEASALAKVPLAGTNYTVGVDNFHKI